MVFIIFPNYYTFIHSFLKLYVQIKNMVGVWKFTDGYVVLSKQSEWTKRELGKLKE